MKLRSPDSIRQTRKVFDATGREVAPAIRPSQSQPRITIVTPSFNQAEYLAECIESVLSQGYPNLEYIIMDGGSTDGSVDIIRKHEKYLAHWQSEPDGGQYRAIEAGLNRGTGEVMAWLNSDDRYWPGTLQTVADAYGAHAGIEWLTGRGTVINGDSEITRIEQLRGLTLDEYLDPERRCFLQQESTFWSRDLWRRTGAHFDASLKLAGDFELWLRFFQSTPLYTVDAVLGSFRLHKGQKTDSGLQLYYQEASATARRVRKQLGLPPDIAKPSHAKIELVTSLVPRNDTWQRLAIRSWVKLGFAVTSLNPPEEHAFLREAYPEVELVATRRDGRLTVGKPCIYFDDILAHLKTSKAEVFGIINSDIYLDADPSLEDFLCREAQGALVYGSRLEVESLHSAAGWTYWMGYDYFFFDSRIRDAYPKSDFMLGVPWWDYWVPFLLVQKGLPIKHLTSPIAYHVSHPIAYQAIQLVNFGNHFAALCHESRAAAFSRAYNKSMGFTVEDSECRDMALLAAFTRHEISSAAQPIAWGNPKTCLLSHALVGLEETEFLVTAIVSTYRSGAFIGECLADLVGQTIADRVEIIVIDAASPENEQAVVAEFQRHHPQIRYIRTPERIGVYAAWNLAARQARGRYLMSCSTNDRLVPHALAMLAQALDEQPEVAVAYGSSLLTRQPHQTPDRFDFSGAYLWPEFSFKQLLSQPGIGPHAMWRRKLHQEFGYFDEQFTAIADQDFWLRVARHQPFWNIHDFTGLYWATDDSLSGKLASAQAEYREIHERHRRSFAFESWGTTRYFTKDIAAQYERRVGAWRYRPTFHVYLRHTQAGFEALATTIQSLSAQYYHDVHIVVLSPHPEPTGATSKHLSWLTSAPQAWPAIVNVGAAAANETDWLLVLADGDTVEPRVFLTLGEAIHTHPDWLFIAVDEDEITPNGAIPHFKPGINLDWLLAVPYLGEAVAVSASLFVRLGGVAGGLPGAEIHDLALRAMDDKPNCIGQVQDILLHRLPGRYLTKPSEAHRQAAVAHLQRQSTPGAVVAGIGSTLRVILDHGQPPAVVVAIPFTGTVSTLEHCISSLLEKTHYPAFRIVVADCRCKPDQQSESFLAGLEQMANQALSVKRLPANTKPAAAIAALIAELAEEYLVVWPEAAVAVQDDWLTAMMNHAQRNGICAVGPRLITADGLVVSAGLELGVLGSAESSYKGVRMEYAGDTSCLAADRRVSALDARCLLLRITSARRAGGIDAAMDELWAVDLAIRLAGQGALVWTPYAIALVPEDLSQLEQTDQARIKDRQASPAQHRDAFLRRWFSVLGRDPYRNSNWDRNCRGYIPECLPALVYDPLPWKPVPKLLARVVDQSGCGHYRIMAPMRALLSAGLARGGVSLRSLSVGEMSALEADICVFQRPITEELFAALEDWASYAPAFRVYEIDDLITQIPEGSPHHKEFTPAMLQRFRRGVGLCDRLVVSTAPLAAAYRHLVAETVVMKNYLPSEAWQGLSTTRRRGRRPRVGWAGSVSHEADLALIHEVLSILGDEVDWILFGRCPAKLRSYISEVHNPVPIDDYPSRLASLDLDIAIAPLEINAFNESRSNLKLLEYGVLGYPVVCSDIVPYQGSFPVTRVRNRPQDWVKAIRALAFDPAYAAAEGDRLRDHVRQHWMLEDHLDEWLAAWLP